MTDAQKYEELLKALGEAFARKNEDLRCMEYRDKALQDKLAAVENALHEAEKELEELKKKNEVW